MQQADYESITPQELKARLDDGKRPLLLDVRESWEYELTKIEGSKLIPLGELPSRASELNPEEETVVICHHGIRSAYATRVLDQAGFKRVFNLEGGLDAYSEVEESVTRY